MKPVVLYIEDNPDNMLLIERVLRARNCELVQAAHGYTGLEYAKKNKPDLILLDINLPDIDGYEIAQRLREDPETSLIPIVAVTANALKGDAENAIAAGCDAYISKPINVRELWENIRGFLELE